MESSPRICRECPKPAVLGAHCRECADARAQQLGSARERSSDSFTRDHPTEAASSEYRAGYARGLDDALTGLCRVLGMAPTREPADVIAEVRRLQRIPGGSS